jgi:hypothetical protein
MKTLAKAPDPRNFTGSRSFGCVGALEALLAAPVTVAVRLGAASCTSSTFSAALSSSDELHSVTEAQLGPYGNGGRITVTGDGSGTC